MIDTKLLEPVNKLLLKAIKDTISNFVYIGGALVKGEYCIVECKVKKVSVSKGIFKLSLDTATVKNNKDITKPVKVTTADLLDIKPKMMREIIKSIVRCLNSPDNEATVAKTVEAVGKKYKLIPYKNYPKLSEESSGYLYRFATKDYFFGHAKVYCDEKGKPDFSVMYELFYEDGKKIGGYAEHVFEIGVQL